MLGESVTSSNVEPVISHACLLGGTGISIRWRLQIGQSKAKYLGSWSFVHAGFNSDSRILVEVFTITFFSDVCRFFERRIFQKRFYARCFLNKICIVSIHVSVPGSDEALVISVRSFLCVSGDHLHCPQCVRVPMPSDHRSVFRPDCSANYYF